jgi:carboxymethylenebutenolidase
MDRSSGVVQRTTMRVRIESVDLPREGAVMRTFVARPDDDRPYPALAFYSDIFQMTESTQRMAIRFASYGYVVAAPEIYWRFEEPGTAIPFDDPGRDRGMADAKRMHVRDFDDDIGALVAFLQHDARVTPGAIGAVGFCLGGHLAFRAAFVPAVKATVCFYPTGLHDGELAGDPDAGSLALAGRIRGSLLLVFGTADPHTDAAGRDVVAAGIARAGIDARIVLYDAAHAFMRDVGPRWDPAVTDEAFAEAIDLFRARMPR